MTAFEVVWLLLYYTVIILTNDNQKNLVSTHGQYSINDVSKPMQKWNTLAVWIDLYCRKTASNWIQVDFYLGLFRVHMLILSHICSPFGAASISLHQCPLTIQEEAPPPQWLTPISCVWLGHWCRTKLWHCTSQSKLCSLSLRCLGLIYSLMFMLNLLLWWLQQEIPPPPFCQH